MYEHLYMHGKCGSVLTITMTQVQCSTVYRRITFTFHLIFTRLGGTVSPHLWKMTFPKMWWYEAIEPVIYSNSGPFLYSANMWRTPTVFLWPQRLKTYFTALKELIPSGEEKLQSCRIKNSVISLALGEGFQEVTRQAWRASSRSLMRKEGAVYQAEREGICAKTQRQKKLSVVQGS